MRTKRELRVALFDKRVFFYVAPGKTRPQACETIQPAALA
jgi:hypothetical protein